MPNFLRNYLEGFSDIYWFPTMTVVGLIALAVVVTHEQNDPERKARLADCQAVCNTHPVKSVRLEAGGAVYCECSPGTILHK